MRGSGTSELPGKLKPGNPPPYSDLVWTRAQASVLFKVLRAQPDLKFACAVYTRKTTGNSNQQTYTKKTPGHYPKRLVQRTYF